MAKVIGFRIEVTGTDEQARKLNKLDIELAKVNATRRDLIKQSASSKKIEAALASELANVTRRQSELKQEKSKTTQAIKLQNAATNKLNNTYGALVAETRQAKNEAKELGARYGVTSKQFKQAAARAGKLDNQLKKIDKSVGDNFRNVGNYNQGLKKTVKAFSAVAIGVGLAVAAFRRIGSAVGASIEAFGEQERTEKALEVALGGTSQALLDQATAFQANTKFGDESIVQAQALLAQLGLQEDQILSLTPAILDFAEAQGIKLEDAAKLVAKSVGSSTNALSRYGISIEGAVGSSERAESALNSLTEAFGGQAEAAAKVGTGPLTQFKNIIGDLQEEVGALIVGAINPFLGKLGEWTKGIGDFISPAKEQSEILTDQKTRMNVLVQQIIRTNDNEERRKELIEELNREYPTLLKNVDKETVSNAQLVEVLKEANKQFEQRIKLAVFEEDITEQAKETAEVFRDLAASEEEVAKRIISIAESAELFRKNAAAAGKDTEKFDKILAVTNDTSLNYFETVDDLIGVYENLGININSAAASNDFFAQSITGILSLDNERIENQKDYNNSIDEGGKLQDKLNRFLADNTGLLDDNSNSFKERKKQIEGLIEAQSKRLSALQEQLKEATSEAQIIDVKVQIDIATEELERLKELGDIIQSFQQDFTEANKIELEKRNDDFEKSIIEAEKLQDQALKKAEDFNKKLQEALSIDEDEDPADQRAVERLDAAAKREIEARKKLNEDLRQIAIDAAQQLSDDLFDAENEQNERELERKLESIEIDKTIDLQAIQDASDAESLILKNQLEKGFLTEQQFKQQQEVADANRRKQQEVAERKALAAKTRLEKEAFEKKKRLDTAQALINGALAVTATFAQLGYPAGIAGAIAVGLSTALAVANIQAQKFAKGGVAAGGNIPTQSNGDNVLATLKTGEVVLTEAHQRALGGADTFRSIGVPGFVNGGAVGAPVPTASPSISVADIAEDVVNTVRVENVATETASVNNEVINVENLASG